MPDFVPGPWTVTRVGACRAIHPLTAPSEKHDICRIVPSPTHPDGFDASSRQANATAALIAAAPDMYAALQLAAQINPYGSVDNALARSAARAVLATVDQR